MGLESGLIRWELCGPELARMTAEIEETLEKPVQPKVLKHHEDSVQYPKKFTTDVCILTNAMLTNPFYVLA